MLLTRQSELEKIFILLIPFPGGLLYVIHLLAEGTNVEKQPMKGKDCKLRQEQWSRQRTRETEGREGEAKWCSYIGLRASSQKRKKGGFWVRISFPSAKCKFSIYPNFHCQPE
jgi:hypothetical protein